METELTFTEKVSIIQSELKAPKDKSTYAYSYRNAEEILGKVKPLLVEHGLVITLDDDIIAVGDPCRWFIKSTATITDGNTGNYTATACAEILTPAIGERSGKASMNESQASGATSSYARKYALGGLLGIDDGDDADDAKYQPAVIASTKPKKEKPVEQNDPKPVQELFDGALTDTGVTAEVLQELNFLPGAGKGNLGLDKEVTRAIWKEFYQSDGWTRGKFDSFSKSWTGTKIPMSAVPAIVQRFCEEAGLSETATKAKIAGVLASVEENDLDQYSEEPF